VFAKGLANTQIRVMCDNTTAVNVLNHVGTSHSYSCDSLAKGVWELCIARDIWLSVAHVPGKQILLRILNLEGVKGKQNGGLTSPPSVMLFQG